MFYSIYDINSVIQVQGKKIMYCNYRMEKLLTDNCKLQKVLFNSKKNHIKLINPAIL